MTSRATPTRRSAPPSASRPARRRRSCRARAQSCVWRWRTSRENGRHDGPARRPEVQDRKSTRLNSSHVEISYAVFCLKKKKKKTNKKKTNNISKQNNNQTKQTHNKAKRNRTHKTQKKIT